MRILMILFAYASRLEASRSASAPGKDHRDPDLKVDDAKLGQPLDLVLDERALGAVRPWAFSLARRNGLPVVVQTRVEVNFKLG